MTPDVRPLETRLRAILNPYRDRLEAGGIYGVDTLRRRGARAHDFFAGVRIAPRHVSFHLMPVYTHPQLLDGISPALRKRLQGKTTFNFTAVEEDLIAELEGRTARGFAAYDADGAAATPRRR